MVGIPNWVTLWTAECLTRKRNHDVQREESHLLSYAESKPIFYTLTRPPEKSLEEKFNQLER